jgi:hypothetical protein
LIGNGKHHLIPAYQPVASAARPGAKRAAPALPFRTQHTGLPASGRGRGGKPAKAAVSGAVARGAQGARRGRP